MAWRPTQYLIDGELDNTIPGKVTGWMRFAGLSGKVVFDLEGNFHRDIRGARIHLCGDGNGEGRVPGGMNREQARNYMKGFALQQKGMVGDMTAGRPPRDYVDYPYLEWYGDHNGRVVIELAPRQLTVIGKPIPWCESDPVSLQERERKMAGFLAILGQALQAQVLVADIHPMPVSDPQFSHRVIVNGRIVGEAHSVQKMDDQQSNAFVRLFAMPENAEFGSIQTHHLLAKIPSTPATPGTSGTLASGK